MNEVQVFNNPEFGDVRTLTIDGEPWFIGSDIAKALGYAKPQNAITTHCRHALKRGIGVQTGNKADGTPSIQNIEMLIIPEGDMYRLISKSKLKSAERFEEWVFDEVLPSIRKTGAYGVPQIPQDPMELLELHYQALKQVDSKVNTLEQRFDNFEKSLPLLPNEADEVSNAVKKRVLEVLGGKESSAYKDRKICQRVFVDAYRELKRNFNVARYKDIKREQKSQALEVAGRYEPPVYLKEQIDQANAQTEMHLSPGGGLDA